MITVRTQFAGSRNLQKYRIVLVSFCAAIFSCARLVVRNNNIKTLKKKREKKIMSEDQSRELFLKYKAEKKKDLDITSNARLLIATNAPAENLWIHFDSNVKNCDPVDLNYLLHLTADVKLRILMNSMYEINQKVLQNINIENLFMNTMNSESTSKVTPLFDSPTLSEEKLNQQVADVLKLSQVDVPPYENNVLDRRRFQLKAYSTLESLRNSLTSHYTNPLSLRVSKPSFIKTRDIPVYSALFNVVAGKKISQPDYDSLTIKVMQMDKTFPSPTQSLLYELKLDPIYNEYNSMQDFLEINNTSLLNGNIRFIQINNQGIKTVRRVQVETQLELGDLMIFEQYHHLQLVIKVIEKGVWIISRRKPQYKVVVQNYLNTHLFEQISESMTQQQQQHKNYKQVMESFLPNIRAANLTLRFIKQYKIPEYISLSAIQQGFVNKLAIARQEEKKSDILREENANLKNLSIRAFLTKREQKWIRVLPPVCMTEACRPLRDVGQVYNVNVNVLPNSPVEFPENANMIQRTPEIKSKDVSHLFRNLKQHYYVRKDTWKTLRQQEKEHDDAHFEFIHERDYEIVLKKVVQRKTKHVCPGKLNSTITGYGIVQKNEIRSSVLQKIIACMVNVHSDSLKHYFLLREQDVIVISRQVIGNITRLTDSTLGGILMENIKNPVVIKSLLSPYGLDYQKLKWKSVLAKKFTTV